MPGDGAHLLLLLLLIIPPLHGSPHPPTHSAFLRAALQSRHPQQPLLCATDPSACGVGGRTCCFGRFCKDTDSDPDHCGRCGHKCAHAHACCAGRCADLRNDRSHCGACGNTCSARVRCSFAMCDYGGGGGDS